MKEAGKRKPIDPIDIWETLDMKTGKEYIRPTQRPIFEEWHKNRRNQRDNIIKLHTGHGKTIIGLVILQSCLNEGKGPALYICPNNYLVSQTIQQAKDFGINAVGVPPSGKINKEYDYTTSTTDPEGNQIYYIWDWGDGNFSGWLGPYDSGDTCEASYIWTEKGNYQVKVSQRHPWGRE